MTEQRRKAPPGWYPHPSMAETKRYWDGEAWTDNIAPVEPEKPSGPGTLTIARGVALGIAAVIGALVFLYSCETGNDDLECSQRNVERVNEGLSPLPCPD